MTRLLLGKGLAYVGVNKLSALLVYTEIWTQIQK